MWGRCADAEKSIPLWRRGGRMSDVVVWEGVSRFGLRGLHVMRMGGKVERDGWLLKVLGTPAPPSPSEGSGGGGEGDSAIVKGILEYEEEGLGIWHLWIWWRLDTAGS